MMSLRFSYGKLSFEQVRQFLMETDKEFPTQLSTRVNIDVYAKKLSEFSDFAVCWDGDDIIGMISCYTNRPPHGYISNVCVKKSYQGQNVFSMLFLLLMTNLKTIGIHYLRLEVNYDNDRAHSIYERYGFKELGISPDSRKYLMELTID